MKPLMLLIVFFISYSQINAQNAYPILMEAYKCINEYDYNSRNDLKEKINISLKPNKVKETECKKITDALEKTGFTFDNTNDTLLLDLVYEDYIVGGGPYSIYARSSKAEKLLSIESYKKSTYKEQSSTEYYNKHYYDLMYSGETNAVKEILTKIGGNSLGCYAIALRIVIKEGRVVPPSLLWNYGCILD